MKGHLHMTYSGLEDFGLRWENGLLVTAKGAEMMSNKYMDIYEIE
jgi:hypothetical protein